MNLTDNHSDARDGDFLIVTGSVRIPKSEFTFTFVRSSGPGGQNVNKVSTKACLRWAVVDSRSLDEDIKNRFLIKYRRRITSDGDFLLNSQRYRDQPRNVADCLEKLRALIEAVVAAPVPRKKRKPSRGARERRLKEKRERSRKKDARRRPGTDD